ncbi:DUF6233 domain-containing protein [Streptomyces sp. NPDC059909]|uniref:DUF6233 domain-containing protein n=1 Tax=Streptomyces sp. NPDC059909 TaxID=3346998 RepID=UPI0036696502
MRGPPSGRSDDERHADRTKAITREQAVRAPGAGVEACRFCRPDSALGLLGLAAVGSPRPRVSVSRTFQHPIPRICQRRLGLHHAPSLDDPVDPGNPRHRSPTTHQRALPTARRQLEQHSATVLLRPRRHS